MPNQEISEERVGYTLPRSSRIRQNRDYRRIYRSGKRFSNRAGLCYVVKTKKPGTRMGFVTTKKIGHAFARTRARRLMKEGYRLHMAELSPHYEVVMLSGIFLTGATYQQAEKAILSLWRKAGILVK